LPDSLSTNGPPSPRLDVSGRSERTQNIRCILFDLGNTLWTTRTKDRLRGFEEQSAQQALAILRESISPDVFPALTLNAFVEKFTKSMNIHTKLAKRTQPELEPDPIRMIQQALHDLGLPLQDSAVCERIYEAYRPPMPETRILFEDVLSTLGELKQRGYILGVVTNRAYGGAKFIDDMRTLGLLDFFDPDAMAISADLGIRKPNPAIYMYALNKLGVVPDEAAMVGDTLNADIVAAKKLNIYAVWKPSPAIRARTEFAALERIATTSYAATTEHADHSEQTNSAPALPIVTNEDVLAYALERNERQHDPFYKPDLIIEQTAELLDVFGPRGD
jgi:FMN phosphatase YigB (HAD superfamily)